MKVLQMKYVQRTIHLILVLFCFQALAQNPHGESGLKKGIVQEVLSVESYTYLKVLEDGKAKWIAVPKMDAKLGEVYYYQDGVDMYNFESRELERKFDTIQFMSAITNADQIDMAKGMVDPDLKQEETANEKMPTLSKLEMNIDKAEGGIQIVELFGNPSNYDGSKVRIRGEVTKYTGGIMGRNWIHFQDGTSHEGAYDLMVTSQEEVKVGDVVVFEGVIALDKDFGAGYFYPVIMEEAVLVE